MMAFLCLLFVLLPLNVITQTSILCVPNLFQILPNCTENRVLEGFRFETINVTSERKCIQRCAKSERCTSLNVASLRDGNGRILCEMNSHSHSVDCLNLTERGHHKFFFKNIESEYSVPKTCKELKSQHPEAPSDIYKIKPVTALEEFLAFCEMELAGGEWTLVYSYRLVGLDMSWAAKVNVWPTWAMTGETPTSTKVPLSEKEEGAMEFDLWREVGEEFLTTSTVTNWYQCRPSTSGGTPGSLTQFRPGDLDCSVVKVQIPETGCDDVTPDELELHSSGPLLLHNSDYMLFWDGMSSANYPTHDPCGLDRTVMESDDPRGAVYIR